MINLTEGQIQKQIIDYLLLRKDLFFQRTNNVGIYDARKKTYRKLPPGQKKGFPDILILKQGVCIGIEVKTATGIQSKFQKEVEKKFVKNGGKYFVVRSFEELVEVLK